MNPQPGRDPRPLRLHAAADLAAALPPRRGRGAGAAVPGIDAARRSRGPPRRRPPRRMFCICNNLGVLPEPFFPEDAGRDYTPSPYLKLLAGAPRRLHRAQRRVAPERGRRPPVGHQLPDRGPAPGQQLVPQLDLARPARRRTHRHADAVPVAHAGGQRRPQPVVDAHGRRDPAGGPGVRRVQPALPAGHARRDRGADPRARHGAEHPGRRRRAGQGPAAERRRPRPRPARPVFHQRPRPGTPAAGVARLGQQAEADGQGQPADRPGQPGAVHGQGARSCTTSRGWPSRPIRPARSR